MFTITDFADHVMLHEYGRPIPADSVTMAGEQHHRGMGFYPRGYGQGVFMPPGRCLPPWECGDGGDFGMETRHQDMAWPMRGAPSLKF
jgi:hypothetical protein